MKLFEVEVQMPMKEQNARLRLKNEGTYYSAL